MNNPYVRTLESVWRNLDNVFVNEEKLHLFIQDMRLKESRGELGTPAWDIPDVYPPMDCSLEEWVKFVCWLNTLNFAFTNFQPPYNKFTVEYPAGRQWSGALALAASLTRAQRKGCCLNARTFASLPSGIVEDIFCPIDDGHRIPMLEQRVQILNQIGKILIEDYRGSWLNVFEVAGWRAFNAGNGIVEQLVGKFPSFLDRRIFNVKQERVNKQYGLSFNKRAQLLVMMYHGRALKLEGRFPRFPLIKDIDDVGPIADYEVPKALHYLGVLKYSVHMAKAIRTHHIFPPGDPLEIENRLAASYVMKKICDEVGINMAQADYCIWQIGRNSPMPHILVPTTDY